MKIAQTDTKKEQAAKDFILGQTYFLQTIVLTSANRKRGEERKNLFKCVAADKNGWVKFIPIDAYKYSKLFTKNQIVQYY